MSDGLVAQLQELFEPIGDVTPRKMFGGVGFFRSGVMFALIADGRFYFRADPVTEPQFIAEGCAQWTYPGRERVMIMPYREVPERLFDEPEEFRDWALAAFGAAERAKAKAPQKPRPPVKADAGRKPALSRRVKPI